MKYKCMMTILAGIVFMFVPVFARAQIIFQDNFDSQANWTYQQNYYPGADSHCWKTTCTNPSTQPPAGWNGWYNGLSWCGTNAGSNNLYINVRPGYPVASSGTCRGGAGKCLTHWAESCTAQFINSDALLAKDLGAEYSEVYVRFYIKFQPGWTWETSPNEAPQHKLLHLQHVGDNVYSPFAIGSNDPGGADPNKINVPIALSGIHTYSGSLYYYVGFRGERQYYFYAGDVGTDMDHVSIGPWATTLGDGNWHSMEFYTKLNTNTGSTFNTDGQHKFWFDGVLKYDSANRYGPIRFSSEGSEISPRRGFNFISIGGNNSNYWRTSGATSAREQWYAIDDVVISTRYIGPDDQPPVQQPSAPTGLTIVQ